MSGALYSRHCSRARPGWRALLHRFIYYTTYLSRAHLLLARAHSRTHTHTLSFLRPPLFIEYASPERILPSDRHRLSLTRLYIHTYTTHTQKIATIRRSVPRMYCANLPRIHTHTYNTQKIHKTTMTTTTYGGIRSRR